MAQRESGVRSRILDMLRAPGARRSFAVAVENGAYPGTPDVYYQLHECGLDLAGWIELKQVDNWPRYSQTVIRVPHFTPQQRIWLRQHADAGGRSHVVVRVGRGPSYDWIVLHGSYAAAHLGKTLNRLRLQHLDEPSYTFGGAVEIPDRLFTPNVLMRVLAEG